MGTNIYYRHLNEELEDDGYHPGCMWSFIHTIDYHHWHYSAKKLLHNHHTNHQGRRPAKGKVNPKTSLMLHESDELQQLLEDRGRSHLLVNQNTKNSHESNEKSIKARIKASISEEVSKQENDKKQKSGYSPRPLLQRTYSIHYLEPSDHDLNKLSTEKEPVISTFDNGNGSLDSPQMKVSNKSDRNILGSMKNDVELQLKKDADIRKKFKVKKEWSFKLGNAYDRTGKFFHTLPNSYTKARLTKSETFPTADSSPRRNFKPLKLEHKKNEIWFSPEGQRLQDNAQVPELALPKYKMNFRARSWTLAYDNEFSIMDEKSSPVYQKPKTELTEEGNDEIVTHVKERKQRVRPEANEDINKGCFDASPNVFTDELSSGHVRLVSEKNIAGRSGEPAIDRDDETDSRSFHEFDGYSLNEKVLNRRSSSFSESLDRYASLFENCARDEVIFHPSKSLKLRNEYDPPSDGQVSFRRIRSLSHLGFGYPIQNEGPGDAHQPDWPIESVENNSFTEGNTPDETMPEAFSTTTDDKSILEASNKSVNEIVERTDTIQTTGNVASSRVNVKNEGNAELDDLIEKVDGSTENRCTSFREEDVDYSEISAKKLSQSLMVSNSGASFLGESSCRYSSEGLENSCKHDDRSDTINLEERVNGNSLLCRMPNFERSENANENFKNLAYSELFKKDDADLLYVKKILERSDLCRDIFNETSRSAGQPLDTSVFKEMEAYWHQELECSKEDMYDSCHHQLLCDLVNEVIDQIYDRPFRVYPKALSSSCRVYPFPVENRIRDEVYANISKLLSRKANQYQTLDDIVSPDLAKDDGWMNHQSESECVALELEDIILDELLEDLLCS